MKPRLSTLKKKLWTALENANGGAAQDTPDWAAVQMDIEEALRLVKQVKKADKGIYDE